MLHNENCWFFVRALVGSVLLLLANFLSDGYAARAESVSFESSVKDAVGNSFDARAARVVAKQYHADARVALAEYFPTIQAFAASEYDKALKPTPQPFFSVGTTTVNAITRFQNIFGFSGNWTLTDFGQRANTYRAARRSAESYMARSSASVRDVRLSVADSYERALIAYKTLKSKQQAVAIYQRLYDLKRRTYEAGSCSRIDLAEQSLQLATAEDAVREAHEELIEKLAELSAYTHHPYSSDNLELVDFDANGPFVVPPLVVNSLLEMRASNLQIAAKRAEIRALWAQQFPKIGLYGGPVFYGTNVNSLPRSISNIAPRVVNIGFSVQWTLFDGFKLANQRDRKRYEIEQIKLERDKKLWELESQYQVAAAKLTPLRSQLSTKAVIINRGEQKIDMYQRLLDSKVTDSTGLLKQQTALLEEELAQEKIRIHHAAAIEKLKIITGG